MALSETGARGTVHPLRIESAPDAIGSCDAVSARALADLDLLLSYIHPWAQKNDLLKAYLNKGRDYEAEATKARWSHGSFDLLKHRSAVDEDSVVLEIHNLSTKR